MAHDGLTARLTSAGLPVLRVHYSSDALKDPRTEEGARWYAAAIQGYPQGAQDPRFRKEMEIEYGALGGQLLFALWEQYKALVVIPPFDIGAHPHAKFYGSYDHGHIHKAVYQVHAVLPTGHKYTVWECAGARIPPRAMADVIKGTTVKLQSDGRTLAGNPYAGREVVRVCDPHLFERRGRMGDDPFESVGDLFRDKYGVSFQKGHNGGELTIASWLIGDMWADLERPTYQIFNTCTQLIWELPRLRHKNITSVVAKTQNQPEQLVDKDNDAWDSLGQFLRLFPSTVAPKQPKSLVGTFAWHQARLQRQPLANTYHRR